MKYLILFLFVFSLGAQDNEAEEVTVELEKMELLKAVNSVLPSTYNLNFTDIESCDLEMTYADEQKQMTWQFNHLSMDYRFDANDLLIACKDYEICIDQTLEENKNGRSTTKFSQTWMFAATDADFSREEEFQKVIFDLDDICTPPTEEEKEEDAHNKALAENARRGWGHGAAF